MKHAILTTIVIMLLALPALAQKPKPQPNKEEKKTVPIADLADQFDKAFDDIDPASLTTAQVNAEYRKIQTEFNRKRRATLLTFTVEDVRRVYGNSVEVEVTPEDAGPTLATKFEGQGFSRLINANKGDRFTLSGVVVAGFHDTHGPAGSIWVCRTQHGELWLTGIKLLLVKAEAEKDK